MSAPIRYAKSDDVDIAYQVVGDGPTDLVFVAGALTNQKSYKSPPTTGAFASGSGRSRVSCCSTSAGWDSRTVSASARSNNEWTMSGQ